MALVSSFSQRRNSPSNIDQRATDSRGVLVPAGTPRTFHQSSCSRTNDKRRPMSSFVKRSRTVAHQTDRRDHSMTGLAWLEVGSRCPGEIAFANSAVRGQRRRLQESQLSTRQLDELNASWSRLSDTDMHSVRPTERLAIIPL